MRKKLTKFQELVFKGSAAVEEKAIKLLKSGDSSKAKELLTTHTYKMLEQALKQAFLSQIISRRQVTGKKYSI